MVFFKLYKQSNLHIFHFYEIITMPTSDKYYKEKAEFKVMKNGGLVFIYNGHFKRWVL